MFLPNKPNFVVYKKTDKIPVNPKTCKYAKTNNSDTWGTLQEARNVVKNYRYDGIGYVFNGDGICGIDLDKCVNNGIINDFAQKVLDMFPETYAEYSVSGTGIHIFVKSVEIWDSRRIKNLEFYASEHYFIITERPLYGRKNAIMCFELSNFMKLFSDPLNDSELILQENRELQTTADVDEIIRQAMQADAFVTLYTKGDLKNYNGDHSAGDLALCNILAIYCGSDPTVMDTIFRKSALMRDKWDRKTNKSTYGKMTIEKAIRDNQKIQFKNLEDGNPPDTKHDDKDKFTAKGAAEWFQGRHDVILIGADLYGYKDGVYMLFDDTFNYEMTKKLGEKFSSHKIKESLAYLKNSLLKTAITLSSAISDEQYLNLKNGLLNLKTFELEPHTPSLKTIIQLPLKFDTEKKCPNIDKFLSNVLPEGNIQLLHEVIGYCLQPLMWLEKAILFQGLGGNGKGTIIAILEKMFGEHASHIGLQELADNRFAAAGLYGKLVNLHADLRKSQIVDSSIFKMTTSGDSMRAEEKYKNSFNFNNRAKIIFSANAIPPCTDNSPAYYRRWIIIPFEKTFDDAGLRKKLFSDEELSGLLNKGLEGLKRLWVQDAFTSTYASDSALHEYKCDNDSAYNYLSKFCQSSTNGSIGKVELYTNYRDFCFDMGLQAFSQTRFNRQVKTIFLSVFEDTNYGFRKWKNIQYTETLDTSEFL